MLDLTKPLDLKLARRAALQVIADQYASEARFAAAFRIGKGRAADVMALLEERGIVGPAGLGVSREVLVRYEQRRAVVDAEFPLDQESR